MFKKKYLKTYKLTDVQAIQLELIKRATFNSFDGEMVVRDLLNHRDLWEACLMTRDITAAINHHLPPTIAYDSIDLIPLRDMGEGHWNVDTLYIIINNEKEREMKDLAKGWEADDSFLLPKKMVETRLGCSSFNKKVLCVWWD